MQRITGFLPKLQFRDFIFFSENIFVAMKDNLERTKQSIILKERYSENQPTHRDANNFSFFSCLATL
jgi:hypothetical protein